MTPIPYILNIPDGPNDPSLDQPNMKINTNSIPVYVARDHVPFGVTNSGYHTVIHQALQATDPAPINGINQVYSKNYTPDTTGGQTDTQLYSLTGLGGLSQLTGCHASTEGWQWCGGVMIQWGRVVQAFPTNTSVNGTVTFKDRALGTVPFPNQCFMVVATLTRGATDVSQAANTLTIVQSSLGPNQFSWQVRVESSQFNGFFWYAIGN